MNEPTAPAVHPEAAIDRNRALARALRITGTAGFAIGERIVRDAANLRTPQTPIREARAEE